MSGYLILISGRCSVLSLSIIVVLHCNNYFEYSLITNNQTCATCVTPTLLSTIFLLENVVEGLLAVSLMDTVTLCSSCI